MAAFPGAPTATATRAQDLFVPSASLASPTDRSSSARWLRLPPSF